MDTDPTLTFLGAAGTVTGSRFLLTCGPDRVLVDCGLFQGLKELRLRNRQDFPVPADTLSAVVVSHAHLDHIGYLPALVRQGFGGPVYATEQTCALAEIILKDSAKLQEDEAGYAAAHGYSKHAQPEPLYTADDVARTLPLLTPIDFDEPVSLSPDITVTLRNAGHILGSASPLVSFGDRDVQFSGDLGRSNHPLLLPPAPPAAAATLVVESTYGNRSHAAVPVAELAETISRTARRGGSIIIPAFAVDRTEVLLMVLRRLKAEGQIPGLPVFLDSPMALRALDVYQRAVATGSTQVRPELLGGADPLDPGGLREASTSAESAKLNTPGAPCIIISASGMATGGRVLHHLKHMLPDARHTVALVGFQAAGTRGRALLEGAAELKMHGVYVPVRAEIADLTGFSVHADADEIIDWIASSPQPPDMVYIVHGEPDAAAQLRRRIRAELGLTAVVARDGEIVRLQRRLVGTDSQRVVLK